MQIQIDWQLEVEEPALTSFIPDFHRKRLNELEKMKQDLAQADFQALTRIAHNWKGFSRPYGYVALETIAKALELAAKDQDPSTCQKLLVQIEAYLSQKKERIKG